MNNITANNYLKYAYHEFLLMHKIGEPGTDAQFRKELMEFRYLDKTLSRMKTDGWTPELTRRLLNHIIIMRNLFGEDFAIKLAFLKVYKWHWGELAVLLESKDMLPAIIMGVNGEDIITSNIRSGEKAVKIAELLEDKSYAVGY